MSENDPKKMDVTIVNSVVLGSCWGISDRRVRQLREEQVISEVARGKFNLIESTRRYCEYLRNQINSSEGNENKCNYETERAAHEKTKREMKELQLGVMKGKLHRSEDVEEVMTDMIIYAKTKLLALPERIAIIAAGISDVNAIETKVEKLILNALNELKEYNPELFANSEVIASNGADDD